MEPWQMSLADFIGPVPTTGFPPPGTQDWSTLSPILLPQMLPDMSKAEVMVGINSNYFIAPVTGAPHQFIACISNSVVSTPVGLYGDTLIVLDPNHAKHWIAEELVLAASKARLLPPNTPRQLTTGSEKTFTRAHELSVRRAHAALLPVPHVNLAWYNLPQWV